jgi:protein-tyrosine-phosphatase
MAEAMVQERTAGAIHARSAGSHPKALNPLAVQAMAERGLDISGRSTKHYGQFARTRFDLVITLCDKVREVCPDFPGAPVTAHWSMPDPAAAADGYAAFVRTADEIDERLSHLVGEASDPPQPARRAHAHR